jgi:Amt family ammonium transporter
MTIALRRPLSVNVINQLNTPPETTPLQKVMIIMGMGVFIALVALTASLPLNYLSRQPTTLPSSGDDDATSNINLGDTAWLIVATIFGILLAPTLSYLYANLYGRTTSFSVQVSLLVGAMITILWIVISFSLTYAKDANNDQILGLPKYYYMFAHVGAYPDGDYVDSVPFSIFAVFELSFPILAASIVTSALIGKNCHSFCLLYFLFSF